MFLYILALRNIKSSTPSQPRCYLQVSAVELHDPLLHPFLVRQQFVQPEELHVCNVIIVPNLRCGYKEQNISFSHKQHLCFSVV